MCSEVQHYEGVIQTPLGGRSEFLRTLPSYTLAPRIRLPGGPQHDRFELARRAPQDPDPLS
jgi:hypothetical protein